MSDLTGKTLGGYRIVEQIGLGGMATVFKAFQPSMDRYVALKVLSTHLTQDPTFVKRFKQEAKVIAKLEHLHILPVYDHGEEEGYLYLVMRFIEIGTLKDRLERGPLSLEEAQRIVNQVGSALEYAHRLGVVHRDLKPSNVLIDPQGDCYLTDFGIAKMVEGTLGLTGSGVLGTPHYMAPEQSQSLSVDHRADVYAMGVVIYQMVTGQLPFDAETPFAVVMKHVTEPLPLPRSIKPDLPESVERVILKALAKDPSDRYQSMRDLVAAFDEAVESVPAQARTTASPPRSQPTVVEEAGPTALVPPPAPGPAWRQWLSVQPLWMLAAAGLALIVLLAAGLILSRVPGRVEISGGQVQVVLPTETTAAAIEVAATPTIAPTSTSAPMPPEATATPLLLTFTFPMRIRFTSTSDWADVTLSTGGDIVDARTVETGGDPSTAEMHDHMIELNQPIEEAEAGREVYIVQDLTLTGVAADQELKFRVDKGALGKMTVEVFNLTTGTPLLVERFTTHECPECPVYFTVTVRDLVVKSPPSAPTPAPQPTATPTPNPMADQARAFAEPILAAIADQPPDFEDDFDHPSDDWPSGPGISGHPSHVEGEMGFDEGEYFVISSALGHDKVACYGGDSLISFPADFVLDITGRLAPSTDPNGDGDWQIQFRKWEFGGFYVLIVSHRSVGLVRHGPDEGESVGLGSYPVPFEDVLEMNRFQIIARGPETAIYVNGKPLFYANDSGYSERYGAGTINLGVCNLSDALLAARWDNLKVWDISDLSLPSAEAPTPTLTPSSIVSYVNFMDDGMKKWCKPDTVPAGRIVLNRGLGRWSTQEEALAEMGDSWPPVTANGQPLEVKNVERSDVEWHTHGPDDPSPGWGFGASVEIQLAPGVYELSSLWLHDLKTCTLTVVEP